MRIYFDSVIIIYLVEGIADYEKKILEKLSIENSEIITSELSKLECRVKPLRLNDEKLLKDYEIFFNSSGLKISPLSSQIIDLAADIRAKTNFKVPDSIHIATAKVTDCDLFLTNDLSLRKYSEIKIEVL